MTGRPGRTAAGLELDGRSPIAVELYAGTAGATAAFKRRGWTVITVDLDRRHNPTIVADARYLPLNLGPDVGRPVELLWMSPPCTEFSDANPNAPLRPSLELMFAALAAVRMIRPRFWILENVRGAIPFLGMPAQKIGPWCLWGYFPLIDVTLSMNQHRKSSWSTAVRRAAVPVEVGEALYRAVDQARGVRSLLDMRPFRRHRHRRGQRPSVQVAGEDLFSPAAGQ